MKKSLEDIKLVQLSTGIVSLISSIFFIILLILLSPKVEQSIPLWIGLPIFLIIILEGSIYWISESVKINEEKLKLKQENIFSQISHGFALYSRYNNWFKIVFLSLIMLFVFGVFGYIVLKGMRIEEIFNSVVFYVQLGTYFVYFLIVRPLIRKFFSKSQNPLKKYNKELLPDYSLEPEGIKLNIYVSEKKRDKILVIIALIGWLLSVILMILGNKQAALIMAGIFVLPLLFIFIFKGKLTPRQIKIKFNEIEEIKELSFVESQSLLKYEVGPDINLMMKSAMDLVKFFKGEIEKPLTYVNSPVSAAKTLLIKGPEIFYLTSVSNENQEELMKNFRKFKSKRR
ncbi:Uncharacterised protein [uncultured archaeon]|nr:Uncharacterised protein [uncultured archaeon]